MGDLKNVDVAHAQRLRAAGALLLDVREVDEWDAGHAPAAQHVPLSSVPDVLDDLPHDRIIVVVCRSGGRSARAGQFLVEHGFDVANLDGGMTAWHEAGAELQSESGDPFVA